MSGKIRLAMFIVVTLLLFGVIGGMSKTIGMKPILARFVRAYLQKSEGTVSRRMVGISK